MNIDDLINSAIEDKGAMIDASDLFAVIGDPATEELFVLDLESYFFENLRRFQNNDPPGTILMGAYTTQEDAYSSIASFWQAGILGGSGILTHPDWVMLIGDISRNNLFSLP